MSYLLLIFSVFSSSLLFSDIYDVAPVVANVKKQKESKKTIFVKAMDEFTQKHYLRAYKLFLLSNVPKEIKLFNAALSLERVSRYEEAFKMYKRLNTVDAFYRMSVCSIPMQKWLSVIKYLELWHQYKKGLAYDFEYHARLGNAYLNLNSLNSATDNLLKATEFYVYKKDKILEDANKRHFREGRIDTLGLNALKDYAKVNILNAKALTIDLSSKDIKQTIDKKSSYYLVAENAYLKMVSMGDILTANRGLYQLAKMYLNIYNELLKQDKKLVHIISILLKKAKLTLEKNIALANRFNLKNTWITETRILLKKIQAITRVGGEW